MRPGSSSRHLETHAGQPCECDVCGKIQQNPRALAEHKQRAHSEAKHRCDHCGKVFGLASRLRRHMALHDEKHEGHQCGYCLQTFPSYSDRRHHMAMEHSDTRINCDSECGLHSATRVEYLEHLQSRHFMQHPATCKCVSIGTKVGSQVARNLGSTAFVAADGTMNCTDGDCDFTTTCARQMESHKEQRHHDAYQPVLRCSSCKIWFTHPSSLKSHNAAKHLGNRRFKCDDCDYVTNNKSNLSRHQTSCRQGKAKKQLQLIDEAFKQLMACCVAPLTTGFPEAPADKKASVQSFEALVAACLRKQASAQRTQQAPMSTGMSSLFFTASASAHHGQPAANTATSSLFSAPGGSHQQPSMSAEMLSLFSTASSRPDH